jgi:hypothetical protein
MAQQRPIAWGPLIGAMLSGAALAGFVGWRLNLQAIEQQIKDTRAGLKKLVLSGGIPPNQDVVDYFSSRETSLEQRYQHWLETVTTPPLAEAASADPQLYFQEQFHEVQRTLERLAAARAMPVPEQLGFPKELPPSDTVPRLLAQLSLIKETAALMLEQGLIGLSSFKIEDPEPVPEEEGGGTFLMRLPLRVRLTSSLPQLMKILGVIERTNPLIDVRAVRIASVDPPGPLEAELLLARYLLIAATQEPPPPEEATRTGSTKKPTLRSTTSSPHQAGSAKPNPQQQD